MSQKHITKASLIPQFDVTNDTKNLSAPEYFQKVYPNEAGSFRGDSPYQPIATFDLSSPNAALDLSETIIQGTVNATGTTFKIDGSARSLFQEWVYHSSTE